MSSPSTPPSSAQYHHYWSTGRYQWYTSTGELIRPLIIGVTGGSGSGKTTVCQTIIQKLNSKNVQYISMDSFYKHNTAIELQSIQTINFDHPKQFDWQLFIQCITDITYSRSTVVPHYSFITHQRTDDTTLIYGADVILIDGLFTLYNYDIRKLLDLCIYVDTEPDICLARRIRRDINERGRTLDSVLDQYFSTVKPGYDSYIVTTKQYADIIIPHGGHDINSIAIDLLAQHIQSKLQQRELQAQQAHIVLHNNHTYNVNHSNRNNITISDNRNITILSNHGTTQQLDNLLHDYLASMATESSAITIVTLHTMKSLPHTTDRTQSYDTICIIEPNNNTSIQLKSCSLPCNISTLQHIYLRYDHMKTMIAGSCIVMGIRVCTIV